MRLRLWLLLGVSTLLGCSEIQTPEDGFNAARAKWTRNGPVSYAMTIHFSCNECGLDHRLTGPTVVEVRNGRIESKTYTSTGESVLPPFGGSFPSIEELFTVIDFALRRDAAYEAEYDPALGYPKRVVTAPGEYDWTFTVTEFRAR